jgi:hypothetical protein
MKEVKFAKTEDSAKTLMKNLHEVVEKKTSMIDASKSIIKLDKTDVKKVKAEDIAKKTEVKKRDVVLFKTMTQAEIDHDARATVRQERDYLVKRADDTHFTVFNATMYRDSKDQLVALSQAKANEIVSSFVEKKALLSKFYQAEIRNLTKSCGGAYGDKFRNASYAISYLLSTEQFNRYFTDANYKAEVNKTLAEKKLKCIYHNTIEESRRKLYEFAKVQ